MSASFLDPDNETGTDRKLGSGHGTDSLGPSDISDTGSDVQAGPGIVPEHHFGLKTGTTSDPDGNQMDGTAGPDIGDAGLDSDSDSSGTGERAMSGRDGGIPAGSDIDTDRIDSLNLDSADDDALDTAAPPPQQEAHTRRDPGSHLA